MKSSNKVVTVQRKGRMLRGLGQTPCEGRFGAHVLKTSAVIGLPVAKGYGTKVVPRIISVL